MALSPPNPRDAAQQVRWQPTKAQLSTPEGVATAFKQLMEQHYALQDQHAATVARLNEVIAVQEAPPPTYPPGTGPTDSLLVGLPVQPIDAQQLVDGALLRFDKKTGTFKFS